MKSNGQDTMARGETAAAFLERVLRARVERGHSGACGALLIVSVPAPVGPLSVLPAVFKHEPAMIWQSPGSRSVAAIGDAAAAEASGEDRWSQLRHSLANVFADAQVAAHSDCEAAVPTAFGGVAFAPGWSAGAPWTRFGDGMFVVPRWTYERRAAGAVLSLAINPTDLKRLRLEEVLTEYDDIVDAFAGSGESANTLPAPLAPPTEVPARSIEQMPLAAWIAHIREISAELDNGRFEKVVAARRCVVRLAETPEPTSVLGRLANAYPDCTAFLFRRDATFLGATPETLFRTKAGQVTSQALAGSLQAGPDEATVLRQAAILARSKKNLGEHEVVAREIVAGLAAHCVDVTRTAEPDVVRVRSLLHLSTAITGRLRPAAHPLDLLETLHPSPAVGGVPRRAAMRWIVDHESSPRGWYTAPVGWIDANGDSEFKVAIRCGVLDGSTAYLYTGAGIVPSSRPAAEYHETALKQLPLLRALGAGL